jgi:hypothetical protein
MSQTTIERSAAAIPSAELPRYREVARRTLLVRGSLGIALLAALVLAFVVARAEDVRQAPLVPSGTTGMLILDMSASVHEGALDATVAKLAETDERTGLVVFSDAAYELLPPGSPSRELRPMLRFFKPRPDATLPANPWEKLRGGTRISTGVTVARNALLRENVTKGSLVLVSDLEILPDEIARLSEAIAQVRADGFQIRIVPLFPTEEKRALVEQLVGTEAFLGTPAEGDVSTAQDRSLSDALPWLFVLAAVLLVALLAVNERVLGRLEVRR